MSGLLPGLTAKANIQGFGMSSSRGRAAGGLYKPSQGQCLRVRWTELHLGYGNCSLMVLGDLKTVG